MTIRSGTTAVTGNPPGVITINTPAGAPSTFVQVRITNNTPFAFTMQDVEDQPGSLPVLQGYTQTVYGYKSLRGNITMTCNTASGTTLPPNASITAEFSDNTTDLSGSYPVSLGVTFATFNGGTVAATIAPGSSVEINGNVTIQQSQVVLLNTGVGPVAPGAIATTPFTIPTGVDVNAIMINIGSLAGPASSAEFALGGSVLLDTSGNTIGYRLAEHYLANGAAAGNPPTQSVDMVPFPGSVETAGNFLVKNTNATTNIDVEFQLIGFTGVIPPFTPAAVPANFISGTNSSMSVATTLLAARTDALQYQIHSAWCSGTVGFLLYGGTNALPFGESAEYSTPIKTTSVTLISGTAGTVVTAGVTYTLV